GFPASPPINCATLALAKLHPALVSPGMGSMRMLPKN
ncbi:MAG: hypothetical protein ACD_22C00115G0005, partial [uncultured bacterium]